MQPLEARRLVGGGAVALGRASFDLLQLLVEHAGALVSCNELIDCAWPGVVIEDTELNVQINSLCRVFGVDLVVTLSGLGCRLAA